MLRLGSEFGQARMPKEHFFLLVRLIHDDPVFFKNLSVPKSPVEWQLMLTLCNLVLSGNGGTGYMIGSMFAISGKSFSKLSLRWYL